MCDFCRSKYKHYMIKHETSTCPFKASLYCSVCACYGHALKTCPVHALKSNPVHKPITKTKIDPPSKPILELSNDDESLKAFLQSKSQMPIKGAKFADLRKLVKQFADERGMELSLVY